MSMKNRKTPTAGKFVIDVGWVFISSIFTFAIGFILRVILGNYFGPEGLGLYTMVLVVQLFASIIGGIGLNAAIVKFVAEHKENMEKLRSLISFGLMNLLFIGIGISLIIYFLSGAIADLFEMSMLGRLLRIFAFIFPFLLIHDFCLGVQNGLRNMRSYAFVIFFQKSLMIFLTIYLIILGYEVEGAVIALVISIILTTLLQMYSIRPFLHFTFQDYFLHSKTLFIFGSQLFLAGMVFMINSRTDMIMIGYFLTEKDLGIYAIAIMFVSTFYMIPNAVHRITYPAFSEFYSKKAIRSIEKMINKCIKFIFIILSILGIILILFGNMIISILFPSEIAFSDAALPLIILVIGAIIYGSISSIGGIFSSIGRPDISLKVLIIITIINLSLNAIFIPLFGLAGAAFATTISFVTYGILVITIVYKMLNITIESHVYTRSLPIIALAIITSFVISEKTYFLLINLLIIILYVIFAYTLLLTKNDKMEIQKTIKSILGRSKT